MALDVQADSGHHRDLIEDVAQRIERSGLVSPGILLLELLKPLGFFAGQLLHVSRPLLGASASRYASLMEEEALIERLLLRLEQGESSMPLDEAAGAEE